MRGIFELFTACIEWAAELYDFGRELLAPLEERVRYTFEEGWRWIRILAMLAFVGVGIFFIGGSFSLEAIAIAAYTGTGWLSSLGGLAWVVVVFLAAALGAPLALLVVASFSGIRRIVRRFS